MTIVSFFIGVLLTWLVMSGLLMQGLAMLVRIWWPTSSREREILADQWLLNNPVIPSTSWRLLGFWKETSEYRQACSEMAGLLADKACLSNQDTVIDMGYSSYDQLLVWLDYYQVDSLTAIARHESHLAKAQENCGHFSQLNLLRGGERVLEKYEANSCDKVLALDCIYKFEDKKTFLKNSKKVLRDGGVLAFTDMVLARPFRDRKEQRLVQFLGRASGIRVENMQIQSAYETVLRESGFDQVEIVDITEDVLSGFCFWFGQHYQNLSLLTRSKVWIRLRLLVWFIRWMLHREQIRYQMIVAK